MRWLCQQFCKWKEGRVRNNDLSAKGEPAKGGGFTAKFGMVASAKGASAHDYISIRCIHSSPSTIQKKGVLCGSWPRIL